MIAVIASNNWEIIECIVVAGFNVNQIINDRNCTFILFAMEHIESLLALLQQKAEVNVKYFTHHDEAVPLFTIAEAGDFIVFQILLDAGADIYLNPDGWSLLHAAARGGNVRIIQKVLQLGIDINIPSPPHRIFEDGAKKTPLFLAAARGHVEAVRCLVDAKADVNLPDDYLNTPLHVAAASGCVEVIEILLDVGAKIDARNSDNATALHAAAKALNVDAVNYLVQRGANIFVSADEWPRRGTAKDFAAHSSWDEKDPERKAQISEIVRIFEAAKKDK
jgi:ankyrin repeat protein